MRSAATIERENEPHAAVRLLGLAERLASSPPLGTEARVSVLLEGLLDLMMAPRGFVGVAISKNKAPRGKGPLVPTVLGFSAPQGAYPERREIEESVRACLQEPAVAQAREAGQHWSGYQGERRAVGAHLHSEQLGLVFGFDRPASGPPFSLHDLGTLHLVVQHHGSFCRRIARELGALDAERLLSPRERDVMELLLTGLSEKEIAHQLSMTSRSVHQRITAIYRNYGIRSRPELMALLLRAR